MSTLPLTWSGVPSPASAAPTAARSEAAAATRLGWIGLIATLSMCALFAIWSASAPLAATAMADGVVKSDRNRRVVQHQEGGIVREVRVRDGESVRAGQVLVVLDDASVRAELRKVRSMLDSELAKTARLRAERDLASQISVPAELAERRGEPGVADALAREAAAFSTRRAALEAQLSLLAGSMAQAQHEAEGQRLQASETRLAAAGMREEVAANEELQSQGFVQKTRVNALQRTLHEYGMREGEAQAQIAQAEQKRADLALRASSLRAEYSQTAHAELRTTADHVEQLRAQLEPSADAAKRQLILAPVAGRVVGLKVNTPGSVVPPRETLAEIVPDDTPLVVEARLRTDAIAQIDRGTRADVRLLAFDQRSVPVLEARVVDVAADRQVDPANGNAYYLLQVEVPDAALRAAGIDHLTAGMPAEVSLHAGDRSALSYLIDPFTHRLERALREK